MAAFGERENEEITILAWQNVAIVSSQNALCANAAYTISAYLCNPNTLSGRLITTKTYIRREWILADSIFTRQ